MARIVVNGRILGVPMAGIPRYTRELLARFGEGVELLSPRFSSGGLCGHMWEQFVLPTKVGRRLLWSPANTGPLVVRNQVVTIHDMSPLDHPEWFKKEYVEWYRFLLPRLAQRVQRIITDSTFSKERILANTRLEEEKVVVIPLGVDRRFFSIDRTAVDEYRKRVGLPEQYVVTVGSPSPRKNLDTLFKAWSSLTRRLKGINLVIGGFTRKVFREAGFEDVPSGVVLMGFVEDEDLPLLYAGALAFVFPSVYEGFGLPPLEAMAAGIPVIASNRTSIPEVVGDAALLVDPCEPDAIADAIVSLVENSSLRRTLVAKGRERARQFTWESTAEQTWQVLASLL